MIMIFTANVCLYNNLTQFSQVSLLEIKPFELILCSNYVDILGRHGSASLCRDERENKMAATYNVLAFIR